jgi:HD-GYP domain-containing protein (c-di-GMP phosphodiesterase class II)
MTVRTNTQQVVKFMVHINAAVANCQLYHPEHPQVLRNLELTSQALQTAQATMPELTFLIVEDDVVVDGRPLPTQRTHASRFARILRQNAIERATFTREATIAELTDLVRALANTEKGSVRSSNGIRLGKVQVREVAPRRGVLHPEVLERLDHLELLGDKPWDQMKEIFDRIKNMRQSPLDELSQVIQRFVQGMVLNVNPLDMLSALKASDEYTYTHAINVCLLTMAQAEMLGVQGQKLHDIGVAAALHDAGKMFVPDEVLNKPGKLTDEEWSLMRHHAIRGARYVLRNTGMPKLAFISALEHHVRYDGSGYPDMQSGWRPNIVSQMIAVSDMFDAMRSRRPYQEPKPDGLIIKILLEESGTSFNPYLVQSFLRIVQ